MGQSLIAIDKEINNLKDSLSSSLKTECYPFENPESLVTVLKVNDQKIKIYWDTNQPKIILSNHLGNKLVNLHDIVGLPKECTLSRKRLSAYLEHIHVRISPYGNNEGHTLYFNLKLLGGANIIDPQKVPDKLWPNAIVPIFVDCNSFNLKELKMILSAVNDWAIHTKFQFKVHFKNLKNNNVSIIYSYMKTHNLRASCTEINANGVVTGIYENYNCCPCHGVTKILKEEPEYDDSILIQKYTQTCMSDPNREESDSCNVCQSFVGRQGGQQLISCKLGDSFDESALKHELGHALGFYHEQQRSDRDTFVNAPNLGAGDPNYSKGFQSSFRQTFGDYDFKSIMHYFFGKGKVGTQEVNMTAQSRIPINQYRQLIELGAPGYTPSFQLEKLQSSAEAKRAHEGLGMVGMSGRLSQTDIDAANYLATAARSK